MAQPLRRNATGTDAAVNDGEDVRITIDCKSKVFIAADKLQLIIGETHPLRDAATAHQRLEDRLTHGKIVLIP